MIDRHPWCFALKDDLCLFIELGALLDVGRLLGLLHQIVEFLVAPLRTVVATDGIAAEQRVKEVVRIAVVAGPAEDGRTVAVLGGGELQVLGPVIGDDLDLDADLGQICLHQLGSAARVQHVRTRNRHSPDLHAETLDASLFKQLLGFFRVVGVVLHFLVVGPHGRRDRVGCNLTRTLEDGVDDGLLVDGHVDRLAHFDLVERCDQRVVSEVGNVQTGLLKNLEVLVGLEVLDVSSVRVRHDVAFAGLQLLRADGCVRRDRKDEIVDLFLALEVGFVCLVADNGIRLVGNEGERAGAQRLLVHLLHLLVGLQLVCIFLRQDRAEVHGQIGEERRFRAVQHELHGQVIDLLDRLDQLGEAHAVGVFIRTAGDILGPGAVCADLAPDGEDDVIGVQVARRRKEIGGLELHALAELERIFLAIGGNGPAFGKARLDLGATVLEFDETAVDRTR
ncbi:hypothetical protein RHSP_10882 [Rhizobium freirei PRF 81]|uniref:NAD-specific glutamate dehydrogenase n=1 Tax=Rhizobium freirei PRF 81 TaxID=363754 RepID=N6UFE0_9HYPH|nr:hypothetical protein RHSP_10882 [Rhizobium freirei PRF 81]